MNCEPHQATRPVVVTTYAEKNPHGDNRRARRAHAAEKRRTRKRLARAVKAFVPAGVI